MSKEKQEKAQKEVKKAVNNIVSLINKGGRNGTRNK